MKLIMATNNAHKISEIRTITGSVTGLELQSLREAGIEREIPEPFDTLQANAQTKARTIYNLTGGENCFSEDTGLEVDFLHGAPGVYSARYSGEPVSSERNIDKLLKELGATTARTARFRTVVCLVLNDDEHFFEGQCEGSILFQRQGEGGFGYDAVFAPAGGNRSFAEMNTKEKNQVSHRRSAINKMTQFLREQRLIF